MPTSVLARPVAQRARPAATLAAGLVLLVLLGVMAVVTAPSARAHDTLIEASPGQDATVKEVPTEVALTFSAEILDLPTSIVVTAADGAVVAEGTPAVDGPTARLTLPPALPNGAYDVTWSVVSSDGHRTDDSYTFTLAAADNQPPPTEPAAETAPSTTTPESSTEPPAASPAAADTPGGGQDRTEVTPSWATMLFVPVGIMALVVVGVLVYKRRSGH